MHRLLFASSDHERRFQCDVLRCLPDALQCMCMSAMVISAPVHLRGRVFPVELFPVELLVGVLISAQLFE